MKFFKSVKTWIATALCATMVASGAVAINAFTNKNVVAAETESVAVSSDIQAMLDSFNKALAIANGKATYVQNYQMANGGTASGIKIDIDCTTKTSKWGSGHERLDLVFNVKNFTGNSSPVASVILSPDEYPEIAGTETTESKGQAANNTNLLSLQIGLHNVNSYKGFTYYISGVEDSGGDAPAALDTRAKPESNLLHRIFPTDSVSTYIVTGAYWPNNKDHTYKTRARVGGLSVHGFSATPYSFWYDYETNVTYRDESSSSIHGSSYSRLGQFLSVDPTQRTKVANFDNKYLGNNKTFIDASSNVANGASNTDNKYQAMTGFKDGQAQFSLRYDIKAGAKASMLFTNVMGLDLTNPNNVYTDNILVGKDEKIPATNSYAIPAPEYQTTMGVKTAKEFTGKVNVYNGARSFPYSYSAYGATKSSITDDLGAPAQSDLSVGDTVDFSNIGSYTLEYIADDGEVTYSTINVDKAIKLDLTTFNTTVTRNGVELKSGDMVTIGDVLKFVPNSGYKLWDYTVNFTNKYARIYKNSTRVDLTADNTYTVTNSDEAGLTIRTAAFTKKYAIKIDRSHYQLNPDPPSTSYVYGGVPSTEYFYTGNSQWNSNGTFYSLYNYDGTHFIPWTSDLWSSNFLGAGTHNTFRATNYKTTQNQLAGFYIENSDTNEGIGYIKCTTANPITLNSNITVYTLFLDTDIQTEYAFIKTKGTVGLSVQFRILKQDYERFANLGITLDDKITGVIATEKYVKENPATNNRIPFRYKASAGNVKIVNVKNFIDGYVTDEVTGAEYKVFYLTLSNIQLANYDNRFHFGAYITIPGQNGGGEVISFGTCRPQNTTYTDSYDKSFPCISVLDSAYSAYNTLETEDPMGTANKAVINGVDYYSTSYLKVEMERIVKFYNYGMYLDAVTTTETEGYASYVYNDVTYYYDTSKIEYEADAERIIKYAIDVIGESN